MRAPRARRNRIITRAQALRRWEKRRLVRTATELALMEGQLRSRMAARPASPSGLGAEMFAQMRANMAYVTQAVDRFRNAPKPSRRHSWRK